MREPQILAIMRTLRRYITLAAAREQLLANPAFDPTFGRIWDFSAITEAQMSEAVVAQLVATSSELSA
jgi:hypothetical protein